jgi:hypothetical protein
MKPCKEIRAVREQFERIAEFIGAQVMRYMEDDVHCHAILGDENIRITFCRDLQDVERKKEALKREFVPALFKTEIWTHLSDVPYFQRLRYGEKGWYPMFPVPVSVELKKHLGNKPQNGKSKVYFILNQEKNLVKIGVSANAKRRLFELKSHNADRLALLKAIDSESAEKLESNLHKKFKDIHVYGEWFSYTDELKSFIEDVT